MKLFKVKTNYAKLNKENENGSEKVSEIRLFEAVDYIDAQKQAIECINNNGCMGECEVEIQKVSYDAVIRKSSEEEVQLNSVKETYWYEIRVTKVVVNEKEEEKYITSKFIVEGEDLEDALDVVRDYLKDKEDEDDWWFTSVTETPISEIIILNLNVE